MIRNLSPSIVFALALAGIMLLAMAAGRQAVDTAVDQVGDRVTALVTLVTKDVGAARTGKCNSQSQAPGMLAPVADACEPRLAIGYARPSDLNHRRGLIPTPEPGPPELALSA